MRFILIALAASLLAFVPLAAGRADESREGDRVPGGAAAALPNDLADLLEVALKHNPDLLLAEAQLREAEARLNQKRLEVTRSVAHLHLERQRLTNVKFELGERAAGVRAAHAAAHLSEEELRKVLLEYAEAGAQLAQVEAEIQYVIGQGSASHRRAATASADRTLRPKRPQVENDHLDKGIVATWDSAGLDDVLQSIRLATEGGLVFMIDPDLDYATLRFSMRLPESATVRSALLALTEYRAGRICFVFRPYGVLVTDPGRAEGMRAATIPADLPLRLPE